jgi:hypothetical protein
MFPYTDGELRSTVKDQSKRLAKQNGKTRLHGLKNRDASGKSDKRSTATIMHLS